MEIPKLPSAAMYMGICQTRAQSANLRWQKAIVFMAINAGLVNMGYVLLDVSSSRKMIPIIVLEAVAIWLNLLWGGLVDRANQWIGYYTTILKEIEEKAGTETGVLIFSSPTYLSRFDTEVKGRRFREGIKTLSELMKYLWMITFVSSLGYFIYILGQGKW